LGTNTGDWIGDITASTPDKSDIGGIYAGGSYSSVNFWHGVLDEVRLSNVERSDDWVTTEYNNQSSPSTFYTISSATSLIAPSQVQWLVADHLGTPRMILDQTGALANLKRHDYLPFGEELFAPAGGRTTAMGYASGDNVRQQFTSYERDIETGLDYAKARYYTNVQGRFTSPDPLLESARPGMPQSWNRYTYCLNNPLMYVDPDGLTWYKKKGSAQPEWFDENENPGDDYEEITQHVYWGGDEAGWVGLDPRSKNWRAGFQSQDEALQFIDPGQEVSLADSISEMSMFTGLGGLARGVFNIGARLGARFFAREAAETATDTAARGLSMEGLAFERKFLFKHLDDTPQAAREASQGSAHVFNDLSTFSRVESTIFSRGTFTGTRDGFARYGFRFDKPIGTRIANDGTRTPLQYGELKLRTDGSGLYHVIPRTGP
jgi:RHS repeat-associated protein